MPTDVVRFGNDLELDPQAYELRQSGRPLKLERIPMELLFLLVEHKGQLVSREEIVERLWGKDVFLDTDNSINAAVRKIRQVLKDDPEKPIFVQTITGKGYRFVAPTTEAQISPEAGSPSLTPTLATTETSIDVTAAATTGSARRRKAIVPAVVVMLALSVAGYFYFHFHRTAKLTEKDTIVLADFTNTTGDSVFDGTLRQGLAVQLEQSPFLSLISDERIQQMLKLMGKPADARLTPEIAQGNLRTNCKRRRSRRLDCKPWEPVRVEATRQRTVAAEMFWTRSRCRPQEKKTF